MFRNGKFLLGGSKKRFNFIKDQKMCAYHGTNYHIIHLFMELMQGIHHDTSLWLVIDLNEVISIMYIYIDIVSL
jgi:hypothetical protein